MGPIRNIQGMIASAVREVQQTTANANDLINDGRATLANVKDGAALRGKLDKDFVDELIKIVRAVISGHNPSTDIPITLYLDLDFDTHSGQYAKCVGGPYDGKTFRIPADDIEDGDMTLKGGAKYKWNGYVWEYQPTP